MVKRAVAVALSPPGVTSARRRAIAPGRSRDSIVSFHRSTRDRSVRSHRSIAVRGCDAFEIDVGRASIDRSRRSVAFGRSPRARSIDRWKTRVRRARATPRDARSIAIGRRVVGRGRRSSAAVAPSRRRVVAASSSSASRSKINTINHRPVVRAFVRRARARAPRPTMDSMDDDG